MRSLSKTPCTVLFLFLHEILNSNSSSQARYSALSLFDKAFEKYAYARCCTKLCLSFQVSEFVESFYCSGITCILYRLENMLSTVYGIVSSSDIKWVVRNFCSDMDCYKSEKDFGHSRMENIYHSNNTWEPAVFREFW